MLIFRMSHGQNIVLLTHNGLAHFLFYKTLSIVELFVENIFLVKIQKIEIKENIHNDVLSDVFHRQNPEFRLPS